MTADGKIAFADGGFTPFSSRRDHEHMMELRATADAVMCGARTVEATGTVLGNGGEKFRKLRVRRRMSEFPLRIIVSGSGSISPAATIFRKRFPPIVVLTTARISKTSLKKLRAVVSEVKICGSEEINFPAALRWLRAEWNVRRLLCEGGGELHGALIRSGLVNELHLTLCPGIFGGRNAPTIDDDMPGFQLMDAAQFQLKSKQRAGDELFAVFKRTR